MENANINGYILKYKLGEGGMAEVWYAENILQKPAAVKVLLKKFCEEKEIVARFENEAKLMVRLDHPHIRTIMDYGILGERPCMVMEYLEGKDVAQRLKDGERFSNQQLIEWWNDLVDALQYTHRKHVIHRDIKPSNLFVTEEGKIKLLDFGVAKIKDNITVTQTGSRMGTLMYMSPEQVYDVKNLTPKTDIYSLAVSFYQMVTGRPPYPHENVSDFEIQESIVRKNIDTAVLPEPWRSLLPDYFHKNPEERKELRKIGNVAGGDETIVINPSYNKEQYVVPPVAPSPYTYIRRQKRRSSIVTFLLVTFIVALVIFALNKLVIFALNKDIITAYFNAFNSQAKNETQIETDKKKNIPKTPVIIPEEQPVDTYNDLNDTIISQEEDGSVDEIIISVDPIQKEQAIKNMIENYYRSRSDCENLSRFFDTEVKQYYSKSNVSISEIQKECASYHGKWRFTEAVIDDASYVFTHHPQQQKVYVDFNMLYRIKQREEDEWILYNIDVSLVVGENNKIERIVERRIEKLS